jgi:anaerobic magnesium-protoporphyrin IX monomethyl ester cyclase
MTARRARAPVVLYQPRDEGVRMPLGLLAVGSALAREHVVIVDGRLDLAPEARVVELAGEAVCLGVTVRSGRPLRDALRVTRAARRANPRLPVVWGGPHATLLPDQCLATGVVDACVVGAGEEALAATLAALRSGAPLAEVGGLALAGAPVPVPAAPPPPAGVPPAQYSLLELERYFEVRAGRRLDYSSSRGRRGGGEEGWWALPPDRVVAEVRELTERYHLAAVLFQEEDFFGDACRVEALARGLLDEGRRIAWEAGGRPEDVLTAGGERLRLLRGSGCARLHVLVAPGAVLAGESRRVVLEAASLLHDASVAARFVFEVEAPRPGHDSLAAAVSVARTLTTMDRRFETPLQRRRIYPPEEDPAAPPPPSGLEEWASREEAPWPNRRAEARLRRRIFYFSQAQRAPGRRLGQRLVRRLARFRVRIGFFAFGFERRAVEASAWLRTGRRHRAGWRD